MKIAYPGLPGAFSHEACVAIRPGDEALACPDFERVVACVEAGEAELGILPMSNNAAGETGAADLIANADIRIVGEHDLPIRMHLLGMAGSRLGDVHTVVSHPIALRQCSRQIEQLRLATEAAPNTALAAAELSDPTRAVLASSTAQRIYGLDLLRPDMQDRADNATRFAIFARNVK